MALEKAKDITRVLVHPDGKIEVTERTRILEDGVEITAPTFHPRYYDVDEEIPVSEDQLVKDVASGEVRTADRIAAKAAKKEAK